MDALQQVNFNQSRTAKEIFSDFWMFIQSEWKSYGITLAVCVLPFSLLGGYFLSNSVAFDGTVNNETFIYVAFLCSFIAKFMGTFISCGYVMAYNQGREFSFEYAKDFFQENGLQSLIFFLLMSCLLLCGFFCFLVPGLILLVPLSFAMYDFIFVKQSMWKTISRNFNLCLTNVKQSFGIVYICFLAIIVVSLAISYIPISGIISVIFSSVLTVVSEMTMIIYILLYYSLANQNMQI